jgi:hypothetical protein
VMQDVSAPQKTSARLYPDEEFPVGGHPWLTDPGRLEPVVYYCEPGQIVVFFKNSRVIYKMSHRYSPNGWDKMSDYLGEIFWWVVRRLP